MTDPIIIPQNVVTVYMKKTRFTIKSLRYSPESLLWLSTKKMLHLYYNILLRVHQSKVDVFATDTDSIKFKCTGFKGITFKGTNYISLSMFIHHCIKDKNGTICNLLQLSFQKDVGIFQGNMKMEELCAEAYLKPKLYALHNSQQREQDGHLAKGVELYQNPTLAQIETYRTVLQHETVMFATNINIEMTKKLGFINSVTLTQTKIAMDTFHGKRCWIAHNKSELLE